MVGNAHPTIHFIAMSLFLSSLKHYGHLEQVQITVVNIGSRKLGSHDDYGMQEWGIFGQNLSIYGFDADPVACEQANQSDRPRTWQEKHLPLAMGGRVGKQPLYLTKHLMCSSLYPPNEPYLARFAGLPPLVNLDRIVEVEITTLDDFCQEYGVNTIDFLQIDIQGAELDVFKAANNIFSKSILAIQTEVEFAPLYSGQPLFGDVDQFLGCQGFTLFGLGTVPISRLNSPIPSGYGNPQILWGEAFYLRDLLVSEMNKNQRTPENLLKLACIADILGFTDYALELLIYLTSNYGMNPQYNFANAIAHSLQQIPELRDQDIANLPVLQSIKKFMGEVIIIGG